MSDPFSQPNAFLFDIGNVILNIDTNRAFEYWSKASGTEINTLRDRFTMDDAYNDFEVGKIGVNEYLDSLRQQLEIDIDNIELLNGWNAILRDEILGIHDLLESLSQIAPVCLFSNTNAAHQELWSVKLAHILEVCAFTFASWEIGRRKPEVSSFLHVAKEMQVEPDNILFFDDSIENITGARTAGMQTVHVTSVDDVLRAVSPFLSATV